MMIRFFCFSQEVLIISCIQEAGIIHTMRISQLLFIELILQIKLLLQISIGDMTKIDEWKKEKITARKKYSGLIGYISFIKTSSQTKGKEKYLENDMGNIFVKQQLTWFLCITPCIILDILEANEGPYLMTYHTLSYFPDLTLGSRCICCS